MGDISNETSMEDILSSIKRIIAEEGDLPTAAARSRKPARAAEAPRRPAVEEADDSILDLDAFPSPTPPIDVDDTVSEAEPARAAASAPSPETILSERVAEAATRQLESLSRMVVKPATPGGDTLEGMVREMLRPMLRDWLDAHLPGMVETMVAREISRITGRNG